jgi:ligand-binding sensor domain-containing protein
MACFMALVIFLGGYNYSVAGVGDWHSFTSKRNVRAVTVDPSQIIWAATDGGMFSYNPFSGAIAGYTTSEGLQTVGLTAIIADASGNLWIGASNGLVHRYDPRKNEWNYITDISSSSSTQKTINNFKIYGDTLFILSDVGVSIYSMSNLQFGDTYQVFGPAANQISGGVLSLEKFKGNYWVGTRSGLTSTALSNPNPSAPESWRLYDSLPVLAGKMITGFTIYADSLFTGTSSGLLVYAGGIWTLVAGTNGLNILSICSGYIDQLSQINRRSTLSIAKHPFFVTATDLWSGPGDPNNNYPHIVPTLSVSNRTSITCGDRIIMGTQKNGLLLPNDTSWETFIPPGPPSNKFMSLVVDDDGALWSATGYPGEGFMSYNGVDWKFYSVETDNRLGDNNYNKISVGPNNSKWVGNWGNGVAVVDANGIVQKVLTTRSGLLPTLGTGDDPGQKFVVVGGVAVDKRGNTWITNRTPPIDTAMVIFHSDSSLTYVTGQSLRVAPWRVFTDVLIDQYNTKWFPNFSRFEAGDSPAAFYYYNEDYSLPGSVSGWGKLTTTDGLTSNAVWSAAFGHDGSLWLGSEQGISIIFYPQYPHAIAAYHPLPDQIIQQILTDPLDNKWIATKQGVFVLSSDGTSILEHYTVASTGGKLLDNDVASLAIDTKNGIMYFGTEKGLSSLATSAISPKQTFDNLTIYPNPFFPPSSGRLTIEGLVQGSTLKVFTVSGELVTETKTPGGRIGFWDGTNGKGEFVPSGVYIIIAYSDDGNQVAKGKVALLRK